MMKRETLFFDSMYVEDEQIPRNFTLSFYEIFDNSNCKIQVMMDGNRQLGDLITDNTYVNDFYRYHDIFHYSLATLLGWSPCTRALMRRKRKSNSLIDEIEDGARATITEEALSLIIFNEAKRKNYFEEGQRVSKKTLQIVKQMTENFEVRIRSTIDWEFAILKAYEIFRQLIVNRGGDVHFDGTLREIKFILHK